jgi:hypothetical protein
VLAWCWTQRAHVSTRILWAVTCVVAVLINPHIIEYDLSVMIPAAVFVGLLVPGLRWTILAFYPMALVRVTPGVGEASVQLTVVLLLVWLAVLLRMARRSLTSPSQAASAREAHSVLLRAV